MSTHPSAQAPIGVTDLFKIGLGPSSSHTTGPMKAARQFTLGLDGSVARVRVTLYGSLAWTGRGHSIDKALVLGLSGQTPEDLDPDKAEEFFRGVLAARELPLRAAAIPFCLESDLVFDYERTFAEHSNAMCFEAWDAAGRSLAREVWFSIGGGFVAREGAAEAQDSSTPVPYLFSSAQELTQLGKQTGLSVADLVLANELSQAPLVEVLAALDRIAGAMFACIDRGLARTGQLPGSLAVKRRARSIYEQLEGQRRAGHFESMEYASVFALSVGEENASGGRIVTAPTNGAAGVVPAVLRYYREFYPGASRAGMRQFLLAATAIGSIIKRNASISGAEVGCQGEVGSASAMAAAGLAAALDGTNAQVENAAEIAMEHHLGITCDPIGGLVQIPCIERNAFGAVKAINAALLALRGDGTHRVSLDQVVETMRQTGLDMATKYKETSRGGLAVNVAEC